MDRARDLVEQVCLKTAFDVMTSMLGSDEGELHSSGDAGRLEEWLAESISAEIDSQATPGDPIGQWSVQRVLETTENAATDALVEWSLRRVELLQSFVDPAIIAAKQQVFAPAEEAQLPPEDFFKKLRREILEVLDRPPGMSDHNLRITAESLAWNALQFWLMNNM
jgi:hypothetical protein